MSHSITYRTVWARLKDVTLGRPRDVIFQRPKDVSRGCPLVLHRGPYGDVHNISFGDVPRMKMQAATRVGIHRIFFVRFILISFPKVLRNCR